MSDHDDAVFPRLARPARRALANAGYTRLEQLAQVSESEMAQLHGMGPSAIATLRASLHTRGLSFRESPSTAGRGGRLTTSVRQVDAYLGRLGQPARGTLEAVRRTILEIAPDAEEVISYGVPAFRVDGKTVAGIAAFRTHLSYLPFSGSVLGALAAELEGYTMTKSALHFSPDRPLPKPLVQKLIETRLAEPSRRTR